jgi:hypothetical protein
VVDSNSDVCGLFGQLGKHLQVIENFAAIAGIMIGGVMIEVLFFAYVAIKLIEIDAYEHNN